MNMAARKKVSPKRAWRPREWRAEVPCSLSKLYELIRESRIKTVKLDGARLILTSPQEFLEGLPEE
jgi:hypothetical protein